MTWARFGLGVGALEAGVRVLLSLSAYRADRDPVMEHVVERVEDL